jgi:hypothetical protein
MSYSRIGGISVGPSIHHEFPCDHHCASPYSPLKVGMAAAPVQVGHRSGRVLERGRREGERGEKVG